MTGTLASRLMRSIRPLPPRGMITSTNSGMAMSWPTASRSVVCTSCTASTGRPASRQRLGHQQRQRLVRLDGFRAAAQDGRVAALDREARGLDGHVGAALVDHAEHADRHAHLAHADAAGLLLHADDLADHVGHAGKLLAAQGHGFDDLGRELEAVDHRRRQAGGGGAFQIFLVGGSEARAGFAQALGQRLQCSVFGSCIRTGHEESSGFGCRPRACMCSLTLNAFMPAFSCIWQPRALHRAFPLSLRELG
jgi:hypothetical protein